VSIDGYAVILYVQALAMPFTVNTMPEATLKALAAYEEFGEAPPAQADEVLAEFAKAGIDTDGVAGQLLGEGVASSPNPGTICWTVLRQKARY
jgi:transaldolase